MVLFRFHIQTPEIRVDQSDKGCWTSNGSKIKDDLGLTKLSYWGSGRDCYVAAFMAQF